MQSKNVVLLAESYQSTRLFGMDKQALTYLCPKTPAFRKTRASTLGKGVGACFIITAI